jgi:hypothetical protein
MLEEKKPVVEVQGSNAELWHTLTSTTGESFIASTIMLVSVVNMRTCTRNIPVAQVHK